MRDLMARRVAPELARKAAESAYAEADETGMIQRFLERKFRGKDLPSFLREEKNLASAYRRLRTAGFGGANSIEVLKRYAALAERLEDMAEGKAQKRQEETHRNPAAQRPPISRDTGPSHRPPRA